VSLENRLGAMNSSKTPKKATTLKKKGVATEVKLFIKASFNSIQNLISNFENHHGKVSYSKYD
jgi:hypothetical protein